MKLFLNTILVLLYFTACSQSVPQTLPAIENPAFADRLETLIPFNIPVIGVDELAKEINKYTLLDAREKSEFQISHIPGSQYLGYKEIDEAVLDRLDKSKPVVLYCSVGYRSDKIGKQLSAMGFKEVYNLYGSIFEWANTGHELIDSQNQLTKKIHTYNKKWSKWVDEGEGLEKVW